MKFNIDVTAVIVIDGILTHKNICSIVFPHACGPRGEQSKPDRRAHQKAFSWATALAATYSASLQESVTPPWRQLLQVIGALFRAMMYPVTMWRVSESAAKSLSTYPFKTFWFSAPGLQYDRPWL